MLNTKSATVKKFSEISGWDQSLKVKTYSFDIRGTCIEHGETYSIVPLRLLSGLLKDTIFEKFLWL